MENSQTITHEAFQTQHLCEIEKQIKDSYNGYVTLEREAALEFLKMLQKNSVNCKECGVRLINQEYAQCASCKNEDRCKRCLVTCGNDPTHKVHKHCLINCELCDESICRKCTVMKKISNIGIGYLHGNHTFCHFDSRICVKCDSENRTKKFGRCSKCKTEFSEGIHNKCEGCKKIFCEKCRSIYKSGGYQFIGLCDACDVPSDYVRHG